MLNRTSHIKCLLVIVVFVQGIPYTASKTFGKIIYVDAVATGTKDGTSWVNAYVYLQDALADASSAEKPIEICVAQGTYTPDQGAAVVPGDREATFQLISGASLKGGYAGLAESEPDQRDVALYETVLSGDLLGDDNRPPQLPAFMPLSTWLYGGSQKITAFTY